MKKENCNHDFKETENGLYCFRCGVYKVELKERYIPNCPSCQFEYGHAIDCAFYKPTEPQEIDIEGDKLIAERLKNGCELKYIDWEKGFEKLNLNLLNLNWDFSEGRMKIIIDDMERIKSFIYAEISKARQETLKEVLEIIKEVRSENESNGRYNACEEIQQKIKEKFKINL